MGDNRLSELIEVDTLEDARALLWACAKHHTFLPAMCELDTGKPLDNEGMRDRRLPDDDPHFRERIGYWQAVTDEQLLSLLPQCSRSEWRDAANEKFGMSESSFYERVRKLEGSGKVKNADSGRFERA